MAAALTDEQVYDLRGDMGDTWTIPIFAPEDVQRFYDRADGDYDRAVVYGLRRLVADPQLYFKHAKDMTEEEKQGTWNRLHQLLADWERRAGMQGGELKAGGIDLGIDTDEETVS